VYAEKEELWNFTVSRQKPFFVKDVSNEVTSVSSGKNW